MPRIASRKPVKFMEKDIAAHVILSLAAQESLLQDIYSRPQIEACGLLTGVLDTEGNWRIAQAHPLRNIFNSPVYFEFAPEDVLAVELAHPDQVIGAYHSHPSGPRNASGTDRENMERINVSQQIPWVWLISCGPFASGVRATLLAQDTLAYHHYQQEGLQRLALELLTGAESEQHDPI